MRSLKRFLRLSRQQRDLLFEAMVVTCVIRLSLGLLSVQRLQRLSQRATTSKKKVSADQIVWALDAAARFVPRATCLVQALAAQTLLIRYGYRPSLTIGVQKNKQTRFTAHAWVTCGDEILVGGQHARSYIPLLAWSPESDDSKGDDSIVAKSKQE